MIHKPVLLKEVLEYLNPKTNQNFIDCTVGEGGYVEGILEKNGPDGKVLGIEADPEIYQKLRKQLSERFIPVNDSYINLKTIVEKLDFKPISGILFDLGMSSWHLEASKRGFSFSKNEMLDMRYNPKSNPLTAEKIVNQWPEYEIRKILEEYGEEKFAKKIAKELIDERKVKPIRTTFQLVKIIKRAVSSRKTKIHFATRTFQALRIAVNDELSNFEKALPQAIEVLAPEGTIVIISFHSLEDRIVKSFFKDLSSKELKILTKKPVTASQKEIKVNLRSRSAKLRAAAKI